MDSYPSWMIIYHVYLKNWPGIGYARRDGGVPGGSAPPAARGLNGGSGGQRPPAWEATDGSLPFRVGSRNVDTEQK